MSLTLNLKTKLNNLIYFAIDDAKKNLLHYDLAVSNSEHKINTLDECLRKVDELAKNTKEKDLQFLNQDSDYSSKVLQQIFFNESESIYLKEQSPWDLCYLSNPDIEFLFKENEFSEFYLENLRTIILEKKEELKFEISKFQKNIRHLKKFLAFSFGHYLQPFYKWILAFLSKVSNQSLDEEDSFNLFPNRYELNKLKYQLNLNLNEQIFTIPFKKNHQSFKL